MEATRQDIDIKDFQSISSAEKQDNVLLALSGGSGAKISIDLLTKILVRDVKPSIKDGVWLIGGIDTGIQAIGKTPIFQTSANGIEWRYEDETVWKILVGFDVLKLKFSDLTPEQIDELRLKFSDLTPEQIDELRLKFSDLTVDQIDELSLKFSDLTPEQIQALKLTLSDLTPEEIAQLQQPATDAIESIQKVEGEISATEKLRTVAEDKRATSETARDTKEGERASSETTRGTNETARVKEETTRVAEEKKRTTAESGRTSSETTRGTNETARVNAESTRTTAETARDTKEKERISKETDRVSAEEERVTEFGTLKSDSEIATNRANDIADHPNIIGEDKYWYKWNEVTKEYDKTEFYSQGAVGDSGVYYGDNPPLDGSVKVSIDPNGTYSGSALTPLFVARGAIFNDKTGYYELNGLTDITEAQIMTIYNESNNSQSSATSCFSLFYMNKMVTNFIPITGGFTPWDAGIYNAVNCRAMFRNCENIKVVNLGEQLKIIDARYLFFSCVKLKTVLGIIDLSAPNLLSNLIFGNCPLLESANIFGLKQSISLVNSPLLSRESILYMINNSANTTPITLTLHPTATTRLTPEDIALASSKNITIA